MALPHKPCGLSWQQQREPEWRCLDVECEQRFLEYEHERRFSSGLPRQNRPGAKRGSVQGDTRGGVSAKRQSVERSD